MERAFDVITFDCYGTLVDWETGIGDAFVRRAAEDGVHLARNEVLAAHREIEPRVQSEDFRSYADVLTEVARRAGHEFGWPLDHPEARFLARSLPGWPLFDDTLPALRRLSAEADDRKLKLHADLALDRYAEAGLR